MLKQIFIISSTLFLQLFDFDWPLENSGCVSSRKCVFFFINTLDISGCRDATVPVDESNEEITERLREKNKKRRIYHRKINCSSKIYQNYPVWQPYWKWEGGNYWPKNRHYLHLDETTSKKKKRKKKEKFIRKRSDDVFDNMGRESIIENLQKLNEVQSIGLNLETNYFRNRLTSLEKSRHLMCWHDGSTSDGHGYIVITISVMFDVAASFSDEEFLLKYGENVCIQPVVEKSSLYIIGRCPSNDQQLLDSDIHLQDISLFRETLETWDGIPIRDKMRIFKGDSPARQFEAGLQKGEMFLQYSREFVGKSSIYTAVKEP